MIRTPLMVGRLALACFVLASLVLASCAFNSHGSQKGPAVWRIVTVPAGARVYFPASGMEFIAPSDLTDVDDGDEVEITLAGHLPFQGRLGELRQIASRTYRVELRSTR